MQSKRMNYLFKSTQVMYRTNRVAFLLFILTQVVISMGFVFFFTTILTSRSNYIAKGTSVRQISVRFANKLNSNQIKEGLEQILSNRCYPENIYFDFSEVEIDGGIATVRANAALSNEDSHTDGGQPISDKMVEEGKKVLVIGTLSSSIAHEPEKSAEFEVCYPNYQVGDTVTLEGNEFEVIGYQYAGMMGYVEIPYTTGIDCLSLNSMNIVLPMGISDNEKAEFGTLVSSLFPGQEIRLPPPMDQKVAMNLILPLSTSVLVGLSAILSFLFLFQYMLESVRREYVIYHVCGASIKLLMVNLAVQLILLFTLCFAAGTALFVLFRQIFISNEFFEGTALYFSQVGMIYLVSLIIILVMALPFLFRFRKQFRKGGAMA